MTTTLMGDFALICEVKDRELLNRLLKIGWFLICVRDDSFIIGFSRQLYNKIIECNERYYTDCCYYEPFWTDYLTSDGNPTEAFENFLNENKVFSHLIKKSYLAHIRREKEREQKIKDMNNKIKLLQEIGDCYMKCVHCGKDIKLPSDFELGNRIKCSCEYGSKYSISISEDSELSKVIILKQDIKEIKKEFKKKKRFWR